MRRYRRWALGISIVGGLFAAWGLAIVAGPFMMKSPLAALLLAPCSFVSSVGPFAIAAICFGMAFGFRRRVLESTRCQFCRRPLVLAEVRECEADFEGMGYSEYLYRCPHCGGDRTIVDA